MPESLTGHVAIRVRRAGPPAVGVAVASAFADSADLRQRARDVLRRILATAPDQPNNDVYFDLPPRPAASFVLDGVVRSAQSNADNAVLLVELLHGCEDRATTILVGGTLLCYPDEGFALRSCRGE